MRRPAGGPSTKKTNKVGHLRQQRASIRTFLSGMLLALAGIAAATLKWWLTH